MHLVDLPMPFECIEKHAKGIEIYATVRTVLKFLKPCTVLSLQNRLSEAAECSHAIEYYPYTKCPSAAHNLFWERVKDRLNRKKRWKIKEDNKFKVPFFLFLSLFTTSASVLLSRQPVSLNLFASFFFCKLDPYEPVRLWTAGIVNSLRFGKHCAEGPARLNMVHCMVCCIIHCMIHCMVHAVWSSFAAYPHVALLLSSVPLQSLFSRPDRYIKRCVCRSNAAVPSNGMAATLWWESGFRRPEHLERRPSVANNRLENNCTHTAAYAFCSNLEKGSLLAGQKSIFCDVRLMFAWCSSIFFCFLRAIQLPFFGLCDLLSSNSFSSQFCWNLPVLPNLGDLLMFHGSIIDPLLIYCWYSFEIPVHSDYNLFNSKLV